MRTSNRLREIVRGWTVGFFIMVAATASALGLARDSGSAPPSRRCRDAVMVDGRLYCDDERDGVAGACRPAARWQAGDRIERCRVQGRMAPRDLAALGIPVEINTARPVELTSLPGIGPTLAERIVAARPFETVDDLLRVRGIGPYRLARLRHRARVR